MKSSRKILKDNIETFCIAFVIGCGSFLPLSLGLPPFPTIPLLPAFAYALIKMMESWENAPLEIGKGKKVDLLIAGAFISVIIFNWVYGLFSIVVCLGPQNVVISVVVFFIFYATMKYSLLTPIKFSILWILEGAYLYIDGFYLHYIPYILATIVIFKFGKHYRSSCFRDRLIVASFLSVCVITPIMLGFYFGTESNKKSVVATDTTLRRILPSDTIPHTYDNRILYEGCDEKTYHILSRWGARSNGSTGLSTLKEEIWATRSSIADSADSIAWDCKANWLAAADFSANTISIYDARSLRLRYSEKLPDRGSPLTVARIGDTSKIAISDEEGFVTIYDISTRKVLSKQFFGTKHFSLFRGGNEMIFNPFGPKRKIGLARYNPINASYSETKISTRDIPAGATFVAINESAGIAAVSDFYGQTVSFLNLNTLQRKYSIEVDRGIRGMYFIPGSNLLLAMSYFSGWLYLIDHQKAVIISREYIGKKGRSIVPPMNGAPGRVTTLTSAGGFQIELKRYR